MMEVVDCSQDGIPGDSPLSRVFPQAQSTHTKIWAKIHRGGMEGMGEFSVVRNRKADVSILCSSLFGQ